MLEEFRSLKPFFLSIAFFSFAFIFIVSLILSARTLHIAPDDGNYLNHFHGNFYDPGNISVWLKLVDEPLWRLWANLLGGLFSSETSLRLTIFLGSFGLLYYSYKLKTEAWIFILLIFIFSQHLATQIYFNQIRQGFALTVFIFGLSKGFRTGIVTAFIASLIHTSFVFVWLPMIIVWVTREFKNWNIYFAIIVVVSFFLFFLNAVDISMLSEYMGRRAFSYQFEGSLNYRFYLIWIPIPFLSLFIMKNYLISPFDNLFWRFTLLYLFICIFFSFIHEAFSRLFYFTYLFIPLTISFGFPKKTPVILAVFWFAFIIGETFLDMESLYGRWMLILFNG